MANTDFSILLKAVLDKSGINTELKQVQEIVNKYSIDIIPELKSASLRNQMKAVSKEIANDFNKTFGTNLTGKDVFKVYENQAKQAEKALENSQRQRLNEQEKYYSRIIKNNKEIYALKEKKLYADKEESKELQRQITNLEKRNKRAYDSISQKGLGNIDWGLEVSNSEKELKNRLAIIEARKQDKINLQDNIAMEKQIVEYNQQELEYKRLRDQYKAEGYQQELDEWSFQYYQQEQEYLQERNKFLAEGRSQQEAYNKEIEEYARIFDQAIAKDDDEMLQQSIDYYEQEKRYQEERNKFLTEGKLQQEVYNKEVTQTIDNYKRLFTEAEKLEQSRLLKSNNIISSINTGDFDTQILFYKTQLEKLGFSTQEIENHMSGVIIAFDKLKGSTNAENIIPANVVSNADKLEDEMSKLANIIKQLKLKDSLIADDIKVNDTVTRLNEQLRKNSNYSKDAKAQIKAWIRELEKGNVAEARLKEINSEAKQLHSNMANLGKIGFSPLDKLFQAWEKFGGWSIATGTVTAITSNIHEAVTELKELDNILTEISKTSNLTESQLEKLGDTAFDTASKYGRNASNYLTGVQEMYRAGSNRASEMAELSVLAQAAGDMEMSSANDYLLATAAAYDLKDNVEELNKILDSQNYITNNAAVSMQDMADATSEAASIAAQYGVEINELSAMTAVVASKTRETGSEVGTALRSIFVTLQDTTSKPVVDAFNSVGISMTKFVDGTEQLKTPIELLEELSIAFNELPEGAIERSTILTDIGKKYHANTLSAILSDWDSYVEMLELYSKGSGSAAREAEKSANNWSGSLNRLSNTWTDTVENIADSDAIIFTINSLNDLLSIINDITSALGSFGTITTVGTSIASYFGLGLTNYVTYHSLRVPFYKVA